MDAVTVLAPERVKRLETELLKLPQAAIVTEHIFGNGVYERKITIPPWTILTGAEHKTAYRVRVEKGVIAVTTDKGVKIVTAPAEFEAPAGAQRAGRVFDNEVVWVDIYDNPDNCTDISVLESRLYVVPDVGLANSRTAIQKARVDYGAFLFQMNMSQNDMDAIVKIESDVIDMPKDYAVELKESPIHGKGLFAQRAFRAGDVVCPGRLKGCRTPGGRFINHAYEANVKPVMVDDDIYAVATREIQPGEELLVDYRASMRVNFGFALPGELL